MSAIRAWMSPGRQHPSSDGGPDAAVVDAFSLTQPGHDQDSATARRFANYLIKKISPTLDQRSMAVPNPEKDGASGAEI